MSKEKQGKLKKLSQEDLAYFASMLKRYDDIQGQLEYRSSNIEDLMNNISEQKRYMRELSIDLAEARKAELKIYEKIATENAMEVTDVKEAIFHIFQTTKND